MQFSAQSADLLRALSAVAGAVPSKSTMPILECVLFERAGGALRVAATDLEVSIVQSLAVRFDGEPAEGPAGRVAIPARRLLDTLRALPDVPLTVATDGDFNVELTTGAPAEGRYKMVGYDGADYPALPEMGDAQALEVGADVVKRAIAKTGFAVSKDALRPAMMGVLFQVRPDGSRVVATDGHRLVRLGLAGVAAEPAMEFIVPEKALSLAAKAASAEACSVRVGGGTVEFDFGPTRVTGRMIDEPYPNYEAVIPTEHERTLTVNRESLLAAVRRVALYSSSMTHQVRLSLHPDRLELAAEDVERSSEATERVLCEYEGEPMEIGFNSVYLAEVLSNLDGEDATFQFSSPNRAGVVVPTEQAEGEDLLMLLMPVMLNTYA